MNTDCFESAELPELIGWLDLRAALRILEQIAGTDAVQKWICALDVPAEQRTALVTVLLMELKEREK